MLILNYDFTKTINRTKIERGDERGIIDIIIIIFFSEKLTENIHRDNKKRRTFFLFNL